MSADGTLSAASSSVNTAALSPQTLGVTQNGQFLYAANFNAAGSVTGLAIGADGALSLVPGSPFPAQTFTYGVDAAPGARTVYSTSFDAAVDVPMNGFAIGADGALAALPGSPYPTSIFGSEFHSVVTTPNQGPTALFTAFAPGAGQPAEFNATSSSDRDGGTVARYDWDFGDGTTLADGGPNPTHVYAQAGNFQVTLTVTDDEGCSNNVLFTGQTVDCNGTGAARISQEVQVAGGTAPDLKLKGQKQPLEKKVTVTAKTADTTDAVAKGKLKIEKKNGNSKSYTLEQAKKTLQPNVKTNLKPKLGDAYKKAKKALKKGGKVTAKVTVKVTDADADTDKDDVKVKLKKN